MDEEAIAADQARRLRAALTAADLDLDRVWLHYFRLGGAVSEMELDAYLHQALTLPALDRDLLSQAVLELADAHQIPHLPLTTDYHAPDPPPRILDAEDPVTGPPPDPDTRGEDDPGRQQP